MTGPLTNLILAAGEGTRMRSKLTKVMHPIAGRPLFEHAVRAAAGLTPNNLVLVVGHGRDHVEQHAEYLSRELNIPIRLEVQEQQKGTGHAASCGLANLSQELTGTVVVSYGDAPLLDTDTLAALVSEHEKHDNAVTVLTSILENPTGYGRIVRAQDGSVEAIVEQRDANEQQLAINEINSGVYAFDAAVLIDGLSRLSTDNSQGELYLTDVLGIARGDGKRTGAFITDDPWLTEGINDRAQLSTVAKEFNRRIIRKWQKHGVTVVDPDNTWIDADVTLGQDVTLKPGVQLHGKTSVGEDSVIGPDTTLTDVVIGARSRIVRTHGTDTIVGDDAEIGPFAYLRGGTQLGDRGKIGTFVETKKANIGAGSKVPHLTYVGDATIGEQSNIGAASVFANYDGINKHHTTIGSHVRTGSDCVFVAPVSIGDGAYSAAGTIIRRDVPPGALAVSGGPQRNIDGWVANRRPGTPAAAAAAAAQATEKEEK